MWLFRRVAPKVAVAVLSVGVALAAACDFGVSLQGLTDGGALDATSDVLLLDAASTAPVVSLGLGSAHTCGVRQDGTVVCWGAEPTVGSETAACSTPARPSPSWA